MDVVLVNPNATKMYDNLAHDLMAKEPPIWCLMLASNILKNRHTVQIIDAHANNYDPATCAAKITDINPKLVVIVVYGHNPSASTQLMPYTKELVQQLGGSIKVLLVGGHIAALPRKSLLETKADYCCTGEGPITIAALLNGVDITNVPGLIYINRFGDTCSSRCTAALIENLDEVYPSLPWHLLDMTKYRAHNWHCFENPDTINSYASIYTSLGCPMSCSFCCIQAPFKEGEYTRGMTRPSYRTFSADWVLREIDVLHKKYGIKNIKIADELFVMDTKRINDICDGLIKRNYNINFWAYARLDTLNEELTKKLIKAGIKWFAIGIESGSEVVLADVNKKSSLDKIKKGVKILQDTGAYICANYIFGLPEDNYKTMQATLDMAIDINAEWANFNCAMAYPGSKLYEDTPKENLPESWEGYTQYSKYSKPLPTKHLSGEKVVKFRDKAFNIYFRNPDYLNMIKDKFGETIFENVKQLTQRELNR